MSTVVVHTCIVISSLDSYIPWHSFDFDTAICRIYTHTMPLSASHKITQVVTSAFTSFDFNFCRYEKREFSFFLFLFTSHILNSWYSIHAYSFDNDHSPQRFRELFVTWWILSVVSCTKSGVFVECFNRAYREQYPLVSNRVPPRDLVAPLLFVMW